MSEGGIVTNPPCIAAVYLGGDKELVVDAPSAWCRHNAKLGLATCENCTPLLGRPPP